MVNGIYAINESGGNAMSLVMKENSMEMKDSKGVYYLWPINDGLYRIKSTYIERPKGSMNYIIRVEIDSAPQDAKIPKKLEELLKKYEI